MNVYDTRLADGGTPLAIGELFISLGGNDLVRTEGGSDFVDTGEGDDKMVLKPEQLPVKPEGCEDPVVWKWGVDSDPAIHDRDSD